MAQGDIYTIDIDTSQTVRINNNSIVLNAIVSFSTWSTSRDKSGELNLLNSNGESIQRLFHRSVAGYTGVNEVIELPMKKMKLNAGEQLQSKISLRGTYLEARITLMEV